MTTSGSRLGYSSCLQFLPGMGPVRSVVPAQRPVGEGYSPDIINAQETISNTQTIPVQPGTHSLLGRERVQTGEVPCPVTQPYTSAAETRTQNLSIQTSQATAISPRRPACISSIHVDIARRLKLLFAPGHRGTEGGHCHAESVSSSVVLLCPTQSQ